MDIELGTPVVGTDGKVGTVSAFIVHPKEARVTHLAVRHGLLYATQKLVPFEEVTASSKHEVHVRFDRAAFESFPDFFQQQYTSELPPGYPTTTVTPIGTLWPSTLVGWYMPLEMPLPATTMQENLPPGEISLEVGTDVLATDGRIGHVEEVCFDPASGQASSIVVRRGFFFHRDVTLPVAWIDSIGDAIRLRYSKEELSEQLKTGE